jgi:hypothetical protein
MEQNPSSEAEVVKKFSSFYGAQRFITVFIIAHHWSLL